MIHKAVFTPSESFLTYPENLVDMTGPSIKKRNPVMMFILLWTHCDF